jgi:hypothetical protein
MLLESPPQSEGDPQPLGASFHKPTPARAEAQKGDVAMDTVQGSLGQVLLVLAGLAVVLFAVILVLIEADFILDRLDKLARRWEATRGGGVSSEPPTSQDDNQRPRDGQGA